MRCHMFSELFYNGKKSQKSSFPHSSNKGMSQFIKKSCTTMLPARFYSPEENSVQCIKKKIWNNA